MFVFGLDIQLIHFQAKCHRPNIVQVEMSLGSSVVDIPSKTVVIDVEDVSDVRNIFYDHKMLNKSV
jgi:hypothetical protein